MDIRIAKMYCLNPAGFHRMAYTTWGAPQHAQAMVCAHGFSRTGRDFDALADQLCADRRVYCPDAAGRGHSDWLIDRTHYNYYQYLRDAATLVAHITAPLNVEDDGTVAGKLDWVGTSMGGMVGMMLAAQPNTPIRRLVLNDIGAQISAASLNRIGEYVRKTPEFATLDEYQDYLAKIHASFGPLSDSQWQHLAQHSYRMQEGRYLAHYDPAIASAFDKPIENDVEIWDLWAAIQVPTLVIRGTQSDLLSGQTLERMCEIRPDTEVLEVADAGHAPALMRDFEIEAIRAFLAADSQT